jgi:hypothetical protein
VDALAEPAFEAVAIEEGHEELEVLFLAVVRRCGHQQEVTGDFGELLAEPVALGVLDFAPEEGRRELVRFVADHEVVAVVLGEELLLNRLRCGRACRGGR